MDHPEDTPDELFFKKKLDSDLIYLEKKIKSLEEAQMEKEKSRIYIVGLICDAVAAELTIREITYEYYLDKVDDVQELTEHKAILGEKVAQLATLPTTTLQSLGYFNAKFDLPALTAYASALERWMGSCRKTVIPIFLSRLRNRNVSWDIEKGMARGAVNPDEVVSQDQDTHARKNHNVDLDHAVLCIERIEGKLKETSDWFGSNKQPKALVQESHTCPSKIYPISEGIAPERNGIVQELQPKSRPEQPRIPVNISPFAYVQRWQQGLNISTATSRASQTTSNSHNITYTKLCELRTAITKLEESRSAYMASLDFLCARVERMLHDVSSRTPERHFSSLLTPPSTPGTLKSVDSEVPTLDVIKKEIETRIPGMLDTRLKPEINRTLSDAITEIVKFEMEIQAHVYKLLKPILVLIEEAGNKKLGQKRKQLPTV